LEIFNANVNGLSKAIRYGLDRCSNLMLVSLLLLCHARSACEQISSQSTQVDLTMAQTDSCLEVHFCIFVHLTGEEGSLIRLRSNNFQSARIVSSPFLNYSATTRGGAVYSGWDSFSMFGCCAVGCFVSTSGANPCGNFLYYGSLNGGNSPFIWFNASGVVEFAPTVTVNSAGGFYLEHGIACRINSLNMTCCQTNGETVGIRWNLNGIGMVLYLDYSTVANCTGSDALSRDGGDRRWTLTFFNFYYDSVDPVLNGANYGMIVRHCIFCGNSGVDVSGLPGFSPKFEMQNCWFSDLLPDASYLAQVTNLTVGLTESWAITPLAYASFALFQFPPFAAF
jgi:hypothetical protein